MEGVRDRTLRRDLRNMVREKTNSTLFEVPQEARTWSVEDQPRGSRAGIVCDSVDVEAQNTCDVHSKPFATLD